ncbi:uncharacterized protein LOC126817529 isoform X2 [Patella vulgata]|uniref:uncharacterized protein LOC126817529 isoform X2 n=1 Tax=Patella vulgata TaxID=6465 RepID=UPI0021809AB2|nr:uncharacterized protein LOC126817529 isoform X2 [Patella vulgata]
MKSLQCLAAEIIGENGHNFSNSYLEDIPRPVFADLLSYLSPETLNRLSETIYKQNINVESLWCRHYEERWHVVCIEGYTNVKYDEFQHRNESSVCQVYHQKHLKDIVEWTVNKSSKAYTLDPYAAYRCPSHILKHSRNKMTFFEKIVISELARKKDNKLIVRHIERFTIRGGMCANILEEKTLIYILLQYVVHIKIVTITKTSLDSILTLLSLFLKNSKIQSVALCHILVKKSQSLEKLLLQCAGNFHNLKYSDCATDRNSLDQSFQNQSAFGDEIDLLDEALMPDSRYIDLRQNQTQLDSGNSDILKAEEVVDCAVLPNSFILYEFNNSALLHTLKDTLPKWTNLRKLAIHGIADFEVESQLFDVILPLINWRQLTDLSLEILLHNSLHIASLLHQLITTYSNSDINNSLGIDNQPLNSFKIGPCNRMYTPEISNSKIEIERFHSMNIPETCNFAKIVMIQTGFFEAVGFTQLLKLLKANHVMESLTLQVFDVDLYNTEERTDNIKLIEMLSQSSCLLHTLNLDGNQFYNIPVDVWTHLLKQKQLLKELSLSHCKLDQNTVKDQKFIRELVNHPNLQIFNISYNNLGGAFFPKYIIPLII